jgi:cytochrome c
MKRFMFCVVIAIMVGFTAQLCYAGDDEDSMALAKKAAQIMKEQGREKGLAEIMNPNGSLRKGKIMVTANDFSGVVLANAAFPKLVGQNHYTLRDADGKYFVQAAIDIAKKKGGGWLEWSFTDFETKKITTLRAWIQRVDGADIFVMAPIPLPQKK